MADVTPSMLANSIMGKIYDVLTNGDDTVPKSQDNFFSWCTPGVPVTPDDFLFLTQGFTGVVKKPAVEAMAAAAGGGSGTTTDGSSGGLTQAQLDQLRASDTTQLYQQAESLSRLVDFVPDVAKINNQQFAKLAVMNDEGTLSEIYQRTLRFSQVMQSTLTDDEKKKLEHFRSLLTATTEKTDIITGDKVQVSGPSPLVQAYNEKMAAYDNAALEYNARRIDAMTADNPSAVHYWSLNANILRDKVKAAMADWISTGYKEQYEAIAAYIGQVEGRDLTLLKQAYLDDLEKAKLTGIASGSDFYYSALVPASFATSTGWSNFSFHSSDYSRHADSHFTSSGWEAHASGGFFGIGASGGGSESNASQSYNGSFNSDFFSLDFEIAQIPIVRPWFKSSYLVSKTWRFDPGNPDLKTDLLTDGGSPPKGLLAAYPTSVIFVRKLNLQFGENKGFSNYLATQHSESQGASASFGFGPFSFGGGASHFSKNANATQNSGFSHTDQGLTVPGMQIIGFKCHVLSKKAPDPDPGIKNWV